MADALSPPHRRVGRRRWWRRRWWLGAERNEADGWNTRYFYLRRREDVTLFSREVHPVTLAIPLRPVRDFGYIWPSKALESPGGTNFIRAVVLV